VQPIASRSCGPSVRFRSSPITETGATSATSVVMARGHHVSILTHHGDGCNGLSSSTGGSTCLSRFRSSPITETGATVLGCNVTAITQRSAAINKFRSSPITETGATTPGEGLRAGRRRRFDPHPSRRRVQRHRDHPA